MAQNRITDYAIESSMRNGDTRGYSIERETPEGGSILKFKMNDHERIYRLRTFEDFGVEGGIRIEGGVITAGEHRMPTHKEFAGNVWLRAVYRKDMGTEADVLRHLEEMVCTNYPYSSAKDT